VTDSDAAELVRLFYAHGGERQPAIALAKAQRELLATAPSMWGAFVVYGSADATDCEASP
jgi:CHAT domain-containing protein